MALAAPSTPPPPAPSSRSPLRRWALRALLLGLALVGIYAFAKATWVVVNTLLLGFLAVVLAIGLRGAGDFLARRTPLSPKAGVVLVVVLLLGAPLGAGALLTAQVVEQWQEAKAALPEIRDRFDQWVEGLTTELGSVTGAEDEAAQLPPATEQVRKTIMQSPSSATLSWIGSFVGGVGQSIGGALFVLIVGIYLALAPEMYFEGLLSLVPPSRRERIREVLLEVGDKLRDWIVGQLAAVLVVGVLSTVGLTVLGVPAALLLGVGAGLLDFIPNFGPAIAGIPAVLVAAGQGKALHVFALYSAIQFAEGWLIRPFIERKAVDTPPALLLFVQILGASLIGFMGLLTAPALLVVATVLISRLYIEDVLGESADESSGD